MCIVTLLHSLIIPQTSFTKKEAYAKAYASGLLLLL